MRRTPAQIRRSLADASQLLHEHELQLAEYGGRVCKSPSKTRDAITRLKDEMVELRLELGKSQAADKRFLRSR